jgi:hypothetical protein
MQVERPRFESWQGMIFTFHHEVQIGSGSVEFTIRCNLRDLSPGVKLPEDESNSSVPLHFPYSPLYGVVITQDWLNCCAVLCLTQCLLFSETVYSRLPCFVPSLTSRCFPTYIPFACRFNCGTDGLPWPGLGTGNCSGSRCVLGAASRTSCSLGARDVSLSCSALDCKFLFWRCFTSVYWQPVVSPGFHFVTVVNTRSHCACNGPAIVCSLYLLLILNSSGIELFHCNL